MPVQINGSDDYQAKYKVLKRKMKMLIYESECFQEELRKSQRALVKVQRDKSFLLDRLLQYHKNLESSSDSEQTEESDNENENKNDFKKRRLSTETSNLNNSSKISQSSKKKKSSHHSSQSQMKPSQRSKPGQVIATVGSGHKISRSLSQGSGAVVVNAVNAEMSREELERHLAARQSINDFATTVSLTLPNQLFSDNIMDGDLMEDEDNSPGNLEEEFMFENSNRFFAQED